MAANKILSLPISPVISLENHLQNVNLPPMFRQDVVNPLKLQLVFADRLEIATPAQCEGLERWAIWTAEGIERRLRDFYDGKENYYVGLDKEI